MDGSSGAGEGGVRKTCVQQTGRGTGAITPEVNTGNPFPGTHRTLRCGRWIGRKRRDCSPCIRLFRHEKRAPSRPAFQRDTIAAILLGLRASLVRPFHPGVRRIPGPIAGTPKTAGLLANHRKRMSRNGGPYAFGQDAGAIAINVRADDKEFLPTVPSRSFCVSTCAGSRRIHQARCHRPDDILFWKIM